MQLLRDYLPFMLVGIVAVAVLLGKVFFVP